MKYPFFRRIQLYASAVRFHWTKRQGMITLLSLFIFFIFCTLGMGMLLMSQIYLKISGFKKNILLLNYASENGIKQGFAFFMAGIYEKPSLIRLSDLEMEELKEDALHKGTQVLEKFLSPGIDLSPSSSWERMFWECQIDWNLDQLDIHEKFFFTNYSVVFESLGSLQNSKSIKTSSLNVDMDFFTGHIPLAKFPFLLDLNLTPEEKSDFFALNPIEFWPLIDDIRPPHIEFSEENILPQTAVPQIYKALKIDLFQPQSLPISQLRQALGLEPTDEPIPEGVYLIEENDGLGGVFVQGDCEKLVLAIDGNFQILSFSMGESVWVIKFSLHSQSTQFITPEESKFFETIPEGIVIFNGSVLSLGGGILNSSGEAVFVESEKIPCLLNGVNLTLISSEKVSISTHLVHQGLQWQEGIPYIKDSRSMLNIFATGKDLLGSTNQAGKIVLDSSAPENLVINASLTASGEGFVIEGENKTVRLLGGLQTANYISNGNTLKVKQDERFFEEKGSGLFIHTPKSLYPILAVSSVKIRGWNEN